MDNATNALSKYIKQRGISISAISAGTNIKPGSLYPSLSGTRPLRADEFLAICNFVGANPQNFAPQTNRTN